MRVSLLILLAGFVRFAPAQTPPCFTVDGDRILARDFAASQPAFGGIPADTPMGPAPAPGARRVFRVLELSTLAKRYGLELESPADLCFERRVEQLDRTQVLEAMRAALGIPDARIEIVETSLFPIPHGKLEFRREGLRRPALPSARTPVEWRGNVIYDDNRRFAIWARVMVSVNCTRVVAVENLKSGELITSGNVRLESLETFPLAAGVAQTIEEVVGRIPWRTIAQGSEIQVTQLRLPPDVNRGDSVEVEVRSGGARLSFTATAESAGRSGEVIAMRNPSSNKVFRARVNGKGHALLEADRPMVN